MKTPGGATPKGASNPVSVGKVEKKTGKKKEGAAAAGSGAATAAANKPAPVSEGKSAKSEIDAIFSKGKAAAAGSAAAAPEDKELKAIGDQIKVARAQGKAAAGKKTKIEGSKDDIFGQDSKKGRKRTEEGYVIYTEEELGLGSKGGDTELCPFDCDCCF